MATLKVAVFVALCLILTCLLASTVSASQWGTLQGCGPQLTAQVQDYGYTWKQHPAAPGQMLLYSGQRIVGGYDYDTGVFRPTQDQGQTWGEPIAPMLLPPRRHVAQNFGVDRKATDDDNHYYIGGQEVSKAKVIAAFGDKLVDDSRKPRVMIAGGTKADRDRVLADIATLTQAERDAIIVQSVEADSWWLFNQDDNSRLYSTEGTPTVYYFTPKGYVGTDSPPDHFRQDEWKEGDVETLRKLIHYNPSKDVDLRKLLTPKVEINVGPPAYVWIGGLVALIALALYSSKRKAK